MCPLFGIVSPCVWHDSAQLEDVSWYDTVSLPRAVDASTPCYGVAYKEFASKARLMAQRVEFVEERQSKAVTHVGNQSQVVDLDRR